jgi:geranylgeranyl pyrophosphate synthase
MREVTTTLRPVVREADHGGHPSAAPAQRPAQCAESLPDAMQRLFGDASLHTLLGGNGDGLPFAALRQTAARPAVDFLSRPGKGVRARLVQLGWELAGGSGRSPVPLSHLVELIHAGSMIVDDIEDGSTHRRGVPTLHQRYGTPLALNTGNLLYFLPFELLDELPLAPPIALALHRRLTRTMLRAHFGQSLDLGTSAAELAQTEMGCVVRAISVLKTGSLMALAASIGASALAAAERGRVLAEFGAALGVALQMLDDLGNLAGARDPHKRYEDLRLARPTWAWAWLAHDLPAAEFAALQAQVAAVRAGEAAPEPLAQRLRAALGDEGERHARALVADALARLRRSVGPSAALRALTDECVRLLGSYG